jgi:hypothetical protein
MDRNDRIAALAAVIDLEDDWDAIATATAIVKAAEDTARAALASLGGSLERRYQGIAGTPGAGPKELALAELGGLLMVQYGDRSDDGPTATP